MLFQLCLSCSLCLLMSAYLLPKRIKHIWATPIWIPLGWLSFLGSQQRGLLIGFPEEVRFVQPCCLSLTPRRLQAHFKPGWCRSEGFRNTCLFFFFFSFQPFKNPLAKEPAPSGGGEKRAKPLGWQQPAGQQAHEQLQPGPILCRPLLAGGRRGAQWKPGFSVTGWGQKRASPGNASCMACCRTELLCKALTHELLWCFLGFWLFGCWSLFSSSPSFLVTVILWCFAVFLLEDLVLLFLRFAQRLGLCFK